jgi:hypothetical protein
MVLGRVKRVSERLVAAGVAVPFCYHFSSSFSCGAHQFTVLPHHPRNSSWTTGP